MVGLAKQEEEIFFPHNSNPLILPRHSQGLYLVQRIRDEAHRFGITAHRNKRSKLGLASQLDSILDTPTGGNALKFYASVRLDIRRQAQIKDGEDVVGNHIKVKVVKNKVAPPFRQAEFDIIYGEGISKAGEIIDMGVEFGIVQKSGSWFSYNNDKLGQGREAVKQLMIDNPELATEIETKIREKIKEMQAQ